jgi:uncharacterized membrane protein YidH (DUF202 family)
MNTLDNMNDSIDKLEDIIKPEIYSKRVIYTFSFLFSSVFGGILLMQNLKDINKKKEATIVLLISILLTVATILITTFLEIKNNTVGLICNIAGAALLSEYFFKKYFPDETDYPKKKIWKPLIIGIILVAVFILLFFVAQNQAQTV